MVPEPSMYVYSSYRCNAYGHRDKLVKPHAVYLRLGHTLDERCAAYRRLFEGALEPALLKHVRDTTNACQVLGSERFIDRVEAKLRRRVRAGKAGRPKILSS